MLHEGVKKTINGSLHELSRDIIAGPEFWNSLPKWAPGFLMSTQVESIKQSYQNNYGQVTELLGLLMRRPDKDFIDFCKTLVAVKQSGVVQQYFERCLVYLGTSYENIVKEVETALSYSCPGLVAACATKADTSRPILKFVANSGTESVKWKQGSFFGFGGDHNQRYNLCQYKNNSNETMIVYIQWDYNIPHELAMDSRLQYGVHNEIPFFVLHDKSQKPFQQRFMQVLTLERLKLKNENLRATIGIDISWAIGDFLRDVK